MSILEVNSLKKIYTTRFGGNKVEALKNVSFSVEEGEYVAIMGESGSGKTTLLNILAALDKPTSGVVSLDGQNLSKIKESAVSAFRRDNLVLYSRISIYSIPFPLRIIFICRWYWRGKIHHKWSAALFPSRDSLELREF